MVGGEFVKIEPEEYNSFDKQKISSKAKSFVYQTIESEKAKRWGFKNLLRAIISGFMHDFSLYDGNNSAELDNKEFGHLQKCAQVVAKLCDDLPGHKNCKVFLNNWFTTLDLLNHVR